MELLHHIDDLTNTTNLVRVDRRRANNQTTITHSRLHVDNSAVDPVAITSIYHHKEASGTTLYRYRAVIYRHSREIDGESISHTLKRVLNTIGIGNYVEATCSARSSRRT